MFTRVTELFCYLVKINSCLIEIYIYICINKTNKKRTMTTYKGFNIETRKELRNQFGGWRNTQGSDQYENGTTEVKIYTIAYKGFEREDEFKSLPSVKRFIDKGRLQMWVKMVDRWVKNGVEPINL